MTSAETYEAQAAAMEAGGRLDDAAQAYDAAIALDPQRQGAIDARARIAMQRDEANAADHCRRSLALREGDPELQVQMLQSIAAAIGTAATPLLEEFVVRRPDAITAHALLAELRSQAGAGDAFAESYVEALRARPGDKALQLAFWSTLSRSGRHTEALALIDAGRAGFGEHRDLLMLEAAIANHAGDHERAGAVLDRLDDRLDARFARGQHWLQTGQADAAAKALESIVVEQPDDLQAWALLSLAWRLTGDSRHAWLCEQPGLYGTWDLTLSPDDLSALAATLRALHRARAQPIGQSVRGGTQTPGNLLIRDEPEIAQLRTALAEGIRRYLANLPAADPSHPLLRHRNARLTFAASWSVRLVEGGFHVAHLHPGGVLSSAFYVSLPDGVADSETRDGWLEIGRPPVELGLDLPPLATLAPRLGQLALFPSYLFHGTRPFPSGERLTVAFDVAAI